jgi:hypothetical protein
MTQIKIVTHISIIFFIPLLFCLVVCTKIFRRKSSTGRQTKQEKMEKPKHEEQEGMPQPASALPSCKASRR